MPLFQEKGAVCFDEVVHVVLLPSLDPPTGKPLFHSPWQPAPLPGLNNQRNHHADSHAHQPHLLPQRSLFPEMESHQQDMKHGQARENPYA
jgi:hypothetical protein